MEAQSQAGTVEQVVRTRFAQIMGMPMEKIDLNAQLFETYGLDSIRALKLISDVEVEFDIDIDQEEARKICTLNHVVEMVRTKRA